MKRYACLLAASFALISCSIPLTKVRYTMTSPQNESSLEKSLRYSDDKVAVEFYFRDDRINLRVENHAREPVEVFWNSATIVSPEGETKAVTYNGYSSFRILPETYTTNFIYPQDHYVTYTGYETYCDPKTGKPLYKIPVQRSYIKELFPWSNWYSRRYAGSEFEVHLPMLIGGERKDYRFRFTVDHVVKKLVLIPKPKS